MLLLLLACCCCCYWWWWWYVFMCAKGNQSCTYSSVGITRMREYLQEENVLEIGRVVEKCSMLPPLSFCLSALNVSLFLDSKEPHISNVLCERVESWVVYLPTLMLSLCCWLWWMVKYHTVCSWKTIGKSIMSSFFLNCLCRARLLLPTSQLVSNNHINTCLYIFFLSNQTFLSGSLSLELLPRAAAAG